MFVSSRRHAGDRKSDLKIFRVISSDYEEIRAGEFWGVCESKEKIGGYKKTC